MFVKLEERKILYKNGGCLIFLGWSYWIHIWNEDVGLVMKKLKWMIKYKLLLCVYMNVEIYKMITVAYNALLNDDNERTKDDTGVLNTFRRKS